MTKLEAFLDKNFEINFSDRSIEVLTQVFNFGVSVGSTQKVCDTKTTKKLKQETKTETKQDQPLFLE